LTLLLFGSHLLGLFANTHKKHKKEEEEEEEQEEAPVAVP